MENDNPIDVEEPISEAKEIIDCNLERKLFKKLFMDLQESVKVIA